MNSDINDALNVVWNSFYFNCSLQQKKITVTQLKTDIKYVDKRDYNRHHKMCKHFDGIKVGICVCVCVHVSRIITQVVFICH